MVEIFYLYSEQFFYLFKWTRCYSIFWIKKQVNLIFPYPIIWMAFNLSSIDIPIILSYFNSLLNSRTFVSSAIALPSAYTSQSLLPAWKTNLALAVWCIQVCSKTPALPIGNHLRCNGFPSLLRLSPCPDYSHIPFRRHLWIGSNSTSFLPHFPSQCSGILNYYQRMRTKD